MTRTMAVVAGCVLLGAAPLWAGPFNKGIGPAMIYGPYTGGHGYSYATAYHYGFPFSAADTWKRDIFAYPAGVSPYRPYGRPIYHRVYPRPATPMIAVPDEDGLPTLVPVPSGERAAPAPAVSLSPVTPDLPPLRQVPAALPATVRIQAPEGAEVWVDKEKLAEGERSYQTEALAGGKMRIFSVRAKWKDAAREVEQVRVVGVKAGETARVKFGAEAP
jgi:uncharacterized protein (TIGR03000 family)